MALLLCAVIGGGTCGLLYVYRRRVGMATPTPRLQLVFDHAGGDLPGEMACRLDEMLDRDEIEHARNRLDIAWKIFDATPVGMVMVDHDGRYTRVNQAMCEFTGYSESELLGRHYSEITHPDDTLQKTWMANSAVDPHSPAVLIEKRYLKKNGEALWAMLVALPVFGREGKLLSWVGQVLDIDRIKRVEQALRVTEERFRGIFENANTGMAVVDKAGRIVCFNDAFQRLLGHDADVLRQMHFDDFGLADDGVSATTFFDEILRGRGDKYRIEKRWAAGNDRIIWVDLGISATRNERGEVMSFIAVVGDITERKKSALALADSKRKLRALASYQEGLLELERKHIAREVHDEMGQLLTALKMDISLMRLRFGQDPGLLVMIDGMRSLVERTINVVRQVASNLRPAVLDHGLLPAIEWLAEDFSKRSAIACRIAGGQRAIDLPETHSTAVFRVVQESLTNVARHALAREVVISVRRSGKQLQVVVTDDGKGFDTVAVGKARGFGLFGMRERILALGGTLRIKSAPGQGTAVSIRLPLASEEAS